MMFRKICLLNLVVVAAAVAAPIALAQSPVDRINTQERGRAHDPRLFELHSAGTVSQSSSGPKVDPLAVGYLIGQGLTPSEVTSWTTGVCSHRVKDASCYAMLNPSVTTTKAVDPLAVGYLIGQRLSPSEVTSWTTGVCSHQVKAASCYAMFKSAAVSSPRVTGSTGFQWGDAGIGAGFTLGIVLLVGGAGLLISRQSRRDQTAPADGARVSAGSS